MKYKKITKSFFSNCYSYYFSYKMISATYFITFLISTLFLMFWPFKGSVFYITLSKPPTIFSIITITTLIFTCFFNLKCGNQEMIHTDYSVDVKLIGIQSFESITTLIKFELIDFILHPFLFILPLLPILIISSTISGLIFTLFKYSLIILITSNIFCRLYAFNFHFFFGKQDMLCYYMIRVTLVLVIILTATKYSYLNPIILLYKFNNVSVTSFDSIVHYYWIYLITIVLLIGFLFVLPLIMFYFHNRNPEKGQIVS